jgi:hypothetical protein
MDALSILLTFDMYPGPVPKDPVTFWCSVGFFSQASTKLHSPSPLSFPRLEVSYSVLADWSWFKMVWVAIGLYPKTLKGFFCCSGSFIRPSSNVALRHLFSVITDLRFLALRWLYLYVFVHHAQHWSENSLRNVMSWFLFRRTGMYLTLLPDL